MKEPLLGRVTRPMKDQFPTLNDAVAQQFDENRIALHVLVTGDILTRQEFERCINRLARKIKVAAKESMDEAKANAGFDG